MEKLNLDVCCGQGFPQTVITSDNFKCVGFGFTSPSLAAFVPDVCCTEDVGQPYLNRLIYLSKTLHVVSYNYLDLFTV